MLKLTDAGLILCDALTKKTLTPKYHPVLKFDGETVTVTVDGVACQYIPLTGICSIYYATFGFFGIPYSSITAYCGGEFGHKTDITMATDSKSIDLVTLPYEVTLAVTRDEKTKCNYLTGIITNATDESITIKYIGLSPNVILSSNASVPSGSVVEKTVSLGVLSYIELDEPITIAPGEDYPFKISLDYSRK